MNVATMLPDGLHRVNCKRWDSQFPTSLSLDIPQQSHNHRPKHAGTSNPHAHTLGKEQRLHNQNQDKNYWPNANGSPSRRQARPRKLNVPLKVNMFTYKCTYVLPSQSHHQGHKLYKAQIYIDRVR